MARKLYAPKDNLSLGATIQYWEYPEDKLADRPVLREGQVWSSGPSVPLARSVWVIPNPDENATYKACVVAVAKKTIRTGRTDAIERPEIRSGVMWTDLDPLSTTGTYTYSLRKKAS